MTNKLGRQPKTTHPEQYVSELKLIIMEEIYFIYGRGKDAQKIIAEWFELNEPCGTKAWIRLDAMSLQNIWGLMQKKIIIGSFKK